MAYTITWVEVPYEDDEESPSDIQVIQVLQFDAGENYKGSTGAASAVSQMMSNVDGSEFNRHTTRFIVIEDTQIVQEGRTTKRHKIFRPIPPKPTWTFEEIKS